MLCCVVPESPRTRQHDHFPQRADVANDKLPSQRGHRTSHLSARQHDKETVSVHAMPFPSVPTSLPAPFFSSLILNSLSYPPQ